jgi:hypothetical protein
VPVDGFPVIAHDFDAGVDYPFLARQFGQRLCGRIEDVLFVDLVEERERDRLTVRA